MRINEENQACIADTRSSVILKTSENSDLKYQFLITNLRSVDIVFQYVHTSEVVAYFVTKNLRSQKTRMTCQDFWNGTDIFH